MHPLSLLAAEPASVIYVVTGAVGLLVARLRPNRVPDSSVIMLFCRRLTREKLAQIRLT
jgi:hypothetical protein